MSRRVDCCPKCGEGARINQKKNKQGKWVGVCFACGYETDKSFDKRIYARQYWNSIPREHSLMTDQERELGTGNAWFQIPRRKRKRWFEERGIPYNKEKLVPLDPNLRRNTTSYQNQIKRAEYKKKKELGKNTKASQTKK